MPQPISFTVPHPFPIACALPQEPKSASDTPAGTGPGPGPGAPGAAATGTQQPAGTPAAAPPCADNTMFLYMGLFLALMYFMVLRPEQKRKKEQQAMLASIKQGDRVVTAAGMHGTVHRLDERTVTLLVDTIKMTFDRAAVVRIVRDDATTAEPKKA